LEEAYAMNFVTAITWIANRKDLDCEYFLVSYVSKSHININIYSPAVNLKRCTYF